MRRLLTRRAVVTRRRLMAALAGTLVAVVATAGGAYAYWTAKGTGSGSVTVGTMQTVTVAAYANEAITNKLYPGGPAGDVLLKVSNPNQFTVTVVAIGSAGSVTADPGHSGCTTTGVTFTPPASPTNFGVGAATGPSTPFVQSITVSGAVSMDATSLSACQGATFHVPVTITVHR
jgi:hypothetical protein